MRAAWRSLAATVAVMFLVLAATAWAGPDRAGILLLAHGGHGQHAPVSVWNANVEQLARSLDARRPTEVAFGMADPQTIQAAVDRLERRGVTRIAVVPLFVSSHSPIIGNFRYILGLQPALARTTRLRHLDRVSGAAEFRFAGAMDAHPLVSEILLERALAVSADPSATTVILIAHGPNDDEENQLWLRDMEAHSRFLRERGGFRDVAVLTLRSDAPAAVKAEARGVFRQRVAEAARSGAVVVVPLLLSAGGIEAEVEADLAGLTYRFAEPLMPHPNIDRWVQEQTAALLEGSARPAQ